MADVGDHILVGEWSDIDGAPNAVSGREKQLIASIFRKQEWQHIVWIPTWLLDDADREIGLVESSDHVAVGDVTDYSEKAWQFTQPHLETPTDDATSYLPKSQVVVFERLGDLDDLRTPQTGLMEYSQ